MREPGYGSGDRVWVRVGDGSTRAGVVIGHHIDWNLYRVVYTVGVAGWREPRAFEEWRLSPRGEEEGAAPGRPGR